MSDTGSNNFKSPQGALGFRILAIGLIVYFLVDIYISYFRGGEGAPTPVFLAIATALLGGGAVLVAILTWKAWKQDREKGKDE